MNDPGVFDFVLLEEVTEANALRNLELRYLSNVVYTRIGNVIVSVNPYQTLDVYSDSVMDAYRGAKIYDERPHIFSVAEAALQDLRFYERNQCVIVSGESGAGKTEASKIFLKYIASGLTDSKRMDEIQSQLILSNFILEAFGNAKTVRNDNSSRFGKYLDIHFDHKQSPMDSQITACILFLISDLLERSRVVSIGKGERNFHIFYQLLKGSSDSQLSKLFLQRNPKEYEFLGMSGVFETQMDDDKQFHSVINAMEHLSFSEEDKGSVFGSVAAILHLGNLKFESANNNNGSSCKIVNVDILDHASSLLGVTRNELQVALTNRSIKDNAKKTQIQVPLDVKEAISSRNALAKGIYGRLFQHVIQIINSQIKVDKNPGKTGNSKCIGVLDIFGFESFDVHFNLPRKMDLSRLSKY